MVSGDKKLLLLVEGVFMNILSLFLSELVQMGLTTAPTGPKIKKIRLNTILGGYTSF